jgi:hypothetical protein
MNKAKAGLYSLAALIIFSAMACGTGQDNLPAIKAYSSCPSDSVLATASDTMTVPTDESKTALSPFGFPYPGGFIVLTPMSFVVTDSGGIPRNKVCLTFLTDGFWFTDSSYAFPLQGVGAGNQISVTTDSSGKATVYWESELLPAAAPVITTVTGTVTTYTPGKDKSGQSFIQVYSGAQSDIFHLNWTVQGEQAP